ncbi:DNA helicase [Tanacetum coccineum]
MLRRDIVEWLIDLLDTHNALVQLFRTTRENFQDNHIPNFKVRLYNVIGAREYELPTGDMLGAIVYETGPDNDMDYDIMLETRSGYPQRVNKLHASYMSLQFPLLFIYGEDGYSKDLKMVGSSGSSSKDKRLTMLAYYSYYLHDRANRYNYLSRTGKLFQQYVVTAFCAIEQNCIDYIREHQNDIRNDYLSGIYDAIKRGDNDASHCGSKLMLPQSFTGGPRYMYSHYLDALAICRVHGNPSYFITFTCNVKWLEITDYMSQFPLLTATDRADVVDRVFEMKIHEFVNYLRDTKPFGKVVAACEALGLLENDREWEVTLEEATLTATPAELRALLAHILAYYQVSDPKRLWKRTWKSMSEDIPKRRAFWSLNEDILKITILKTNTPYPSRKIRRIRACTHQRPQKNKAQYAFGLWTTTYYKSPSSAGRTAHSRFKIPFDLTDTSVCAIKKNTQMADLLKETCLIVWDESPKNDRQCFETLDRTLRDILDQPNYLFGGKTVMLGGDFRQTLPVKRENMRLDNENLSEINRHRTAVFAEWLLDIGNIKIGTLDDSDPENTSWIDIPNEYCIPNDENGITNLIDFIYDDDTLHYPSAQKFQEKAIICPKNNVADVINTKILSLLTTTTRTYLSYDDAIPHGHDGGEVKLLYPKEYLNNLSFPGLPPHRMKAGFLDSGGGGGKKKKNNSNDSPINTVMESANGDELNEVLGTTPYSKDTMNDDSPSGVASKVREGVTPSMDDTTISGSFPPLSTSVLLRLVMPLAISERFANTAYGFFLGKKMAYPVVANYDCYGLRRRHAFIHNNPLILKKWHPDENLLKEDVSTVPVWVKLHGVPVTAFSEDGLSAIATKLGTPLMLRGEGGAMRASA